MTQLKKFDLVVIGAGIHGAGVAQAAAAKGLSVLVLERREAAGMETSRASSKLIHGGLRYLETGQFRLVYECLREQRYLLRNAPHLVRRSDFYIPVYRQSSRSPWWVHLGLCCYHMLAGWAKEHAIERLSLEQRASLDIRQQDLLAVYRYTDAQTDDQALTRAVLESARSLGAEVRFNTWCDQMEYAGEFRLRLNDGSEVTSHALVNAAGPWANEVAKIGGFQQQDVDWVQGVHIVLKQPSGAGCFYVEAADGRAVFVLPWRGMTMVGTTELIVDSPKAQATQAEIDYLLNVYNHYFPQSTQTAADVTEVFAGVRVLPKDNRIANKRSRETLFVSDAGGAYVAIYGGKLTSYRATAEKVMEQLSPVLRDAVSDKTAFARSTINLPLR